MSTRTRKLIAITLFVLSTSMSSLAAPRDAREPREPRDRPSIVRRVIVRLRAFIPVRLEDTLSIPNP